MSAKDRTQLNCKIHGKLNHENIHMRIVRDKDPISVFFRCFLCEKERHKLRVTNYEYYNENIKNKYLNCHICKDNKTINQFTKSELKKKFAYVCKNCVKARNLKSLNYNKIANNRAIKKYNLNLDLYKKIKIKQNNKCKICNQEEKKIRKKDGSLYELCIDHSHRSGKVRGLLCKSCNLLLGNSFDNPDLLRKAAKYLEEND